MTHEEPQRAEKIDEKLLELLIGVYNYAASAEISQGHVFALFHEVYQDNIYKEERVNDR
jgi:hypothetical protein